MSPNEDVVTKADDKEQIIYASIELIEIYKCKNEKLYMSLRRTEV